MRAKLFFLSLHIMCMYTQQLEALEGYFYDKPKPARLSQNVNHNDDHDLLAKLEIGEMSSEEMQAVRIEQPIRNDSNVTPPGVIADFIDDLIDQQKHNIVSSIFSNKNFKSPSNAKLLQNPVFGSQTKKDLTIEKGIFNGQKCASCTCGLPNVNRIVGGIMVRANKYPWIAQLLVGNVNFFCGGTLINDRYVLTAAHCIHDIMSNNISVRIMQYDRGLSKDGIHRVAIKIIMHQQYNPTTMAHDIALLRLNKPVPLVNPIRPVCLPNNYNQNFDFKEAVAAGWGLNHELAEQASQVLQEVNVPILTHAQCRATSYKSMIVETMLCAGYVKTGGKDACQGDSGGPLVVRDKNIFQLAGVVSFGYGCAQPNAPGVYTRVSKYLDWISSRTKDACYCAN